MLLLNAQCKDCAFSEAAAHNGDINRVTNKVKQHVAKTGHTVVVERGDSIIYSKI